MLLDSRLLGTQGVDALADRKVRVGADTANGLHLDAVELEHAAIRLRVGATDAGQALSFRANGARGWAR